MKIERTLNAYGKIVVKVVTDEDIEDMEWAVVLEDHGDEYLIVKTKDKHLYKYGCFANLKDSEWILKSLMKQPEMYGKIEATTSNDIYWLIHKNLFEEVGYFGREEIKKYSSKESAQFQFDHFIERLNKIHEDSKYVYDSSSHIDEAVNFLIKNDIDTKENIDKLNSAHWDSKVDGVDGIAGKQDISGLEQIYFEGMGDVYVVERNDLEVVEDYDPDEWGYSGYYLNIEHDKKLAANKELHKLVFGELDEEDGDAWGDWMKDEEMMLSKFISVLFDKTFIDSETGEALYLVINKSARQPLASYVDAETVLRMINVETILLRAGEE